ncbi:uncharacterized protein LOC134842389 isoform X3 [Symsagittifera roscoffensis]
MFKSMNPDNNRAELDWADKILDPNNRQFHDSSIVESDPYANLDRSHTSYSTLPLSLSRTRNKSEQNPLEEQFEAPRNNMYKSANQSEFSNTRRPRSQTRMHNEHISYLEPTDFALRSPLQGGNLNQPDLLSMNTTPHASDQINAEGRPSSSNSQAATRYRRDKPRRADEFKQIRSFFDNLGQGNENGDGGPAQHIRTQSLDRAKSSNKAKFLSQSRQRFPEGKDSTDFPRSGGLGRNSVKGNSRWQLSSFDENFVARNQYRYTIREPKNLKPPRPELPPSAAIDTDFIVRNSRFRNTSGGDYPQPRENNENNKSGISSDLLLDETFRAIFDQKNEEFSRSNENLIDTRVQNEPAKAVSTYKLSLKSPDSSNEKPPGFDSRKMNMPINNRFIDSESDDDVSLQSQIENHSRVKPNNFASSPSNVIHNPNMRANLEQTLQNCNGKINGNHKGLYGSTGSLKSAPIPFQKNNNDLIQLEDSFTPAIPRNEERGHESRKPRDKSPLVKSGIDLWETRIETVEVEKVQREREDLKGKKSVSPFETEVQRFEPRIRSRSENPLNMVNNVLQDGILSPPPGSNKSSLKESEADPNEYNFSMSAKFAAVNSIPQPYNRQKIGGVPFEPSSKFRPSHVKPIQTSERNEIQDFKLGSNPSLVQYDEKMVTETQTSEASRAFDLPVKVYDDFAEDHLATVQNEVTEKFIYFPHTKKLIKVSPEDETESYLKQVNLAHRDVGYFITLKKQVTEDRLTKIEAISDRTQENAKIKDDVRDLARSLHDRTANNERDANQKESSLQRGSSAADKFTKMDRAWNKAADDQPTVNLFGANQQSSPFDNFSNKLKGHILDNKKPNKAQETEIGRDFPMSPTESPAYFPNARSPMNEPFAYRDDKMNHGDNHIYNRRFKKNDSNTYRNVGLVQPMPGNRSISVDALNFGGMGSENTGRVPLNQSNQQLSEKNRSRMSLMSHGGEMYDNQFPEGQRVFQSASPTVMDVKNVKNTQGQPEGRSGSFNQQNQFDHVPMVGAKGNVHAEIGSDFNPKEGDSGVDLDYYSPNSDDIKYPVQSKHDDGLLDPNSGHPQDTQMSRHSPHMDHQPVENEFQQDNGGFGGGDVPLHIPKNETAQSKEGSKPIKKYYDEESVSETTCCGPKKIFKKRSKSRDDALSKTASEPSPSLSNGNRKNAPRGNNKPKEEQVHSTADNNFKSSFSHQVNPPLKKEREEQEPIYATVIHSFRAQADYELEVKKTDTVMIKKEIDANWFEVRANGRVGLVPKANLRIIQNNTAQNSQNAPNSTDNSSLPRSKTNPSLNSEFTEGRSRRDMHDPKFQGNQSEQQGSSVNAPNRSESNSMKPLSVEVSGGVIQAQHEKQVSNSLSQKKPGEIVEGDKVVAKYAFSAQSANELDLKKRDVVTVTKKVDENWLEGMLGSRSGIFPATYVQKVSPQSQPEMLRGPVSSKMAGFDNMPASKMPQSGGQDFGPRNIVNAESTYQNPVKKNLGGSAVISEMFPTVGRAQEQEGGTTKVHHSPLGDSSQWQQHNYSSLKKWPEQNLAEHNQARSPVGMGMGSNSALNATNLTVNTSATSESGHHGESLDREEARRQEEPYRVKFRYDPSSHDELALEEGEIVFVTEKCDDGWFIGYPQKNKLLCGAFPGNYVVKIS